MSVEIEVFNGFDGFVFKKVYVFSCCLKFLGFRLMGFFIRFFKCFYEVVVGFFSSE